MAMISRRKLLIFLSAALLAGGVLLLVLLTRARTRASRLDRVVLVTIDTVRADHLGCYGYPRSTSPFIDELARRGVQFMRAFAPVGITTPSHASIFTSLHPLQHNVLANGHRLDEKHHTLAEALRAAGFHTAAFVSVSKLFSGANLHQGFSHFDEPTTDSDDRYRTARGTVDAVLEWLDRRRPAGKLFLWVHLFDPHHPYRPPRSHLAPFAAQTGEERRSLQAFLTNQHHLDLQFFAELQRFWTSPDSADLAASAERSGPQFGRALNKGTRTGQDLLDRLIDAYDGEIAFVDAELRRLWSHLQRGDARTLWIVAGDHGEGLGNHRYLMHGRHIYNEQLHVPLIVSLPDQRMPGKKVTEIVELLDIFPTMLELTGVKPDSAMKRRGRSLVPLLLGAREMSGRHTLAARKQPESLQKKTTRLVNVMIEKGLVPEARGDQLAIQDDRFKYIQRETGPDELFDLSRDPYEQDNIINRVPKQASRLRKLLLREVKQLELDARSRPARADEETLRQLRSLGYIQ